LSAGGFQTLLKNCYEKLNIYKLLTSPIQLVSSVYALTYFEKLASLRARLLFTQHLTVSSYGS